MALEKTIDVLGIGNAIIDVLADADDAFLLQHNLNKGSMTLVDEEASSNIYSSMKNKIHISVKQSYKNFMKQLHFQL